MAFQPPSSDGWTDWLESGLIERSGAMEDGMIALDSENGKGLGFTSDSFESGSYLWKDGDDIVVSFIWSKAKGNFKKLVDAIKGKSMTVVIPTPLGRMQDIVIKNGYTHKTIDSEMGLCEVWIL